MKSRYLSVREELSHFYGWTPPGPRLRQSRAEQPEAKPQQPQPPASVQLLSGNSLQAQPMWPHTHCFNVRSCRECTFRIQNCPCGVLRLNLLRGTGILFVKFSPAFMWLVMCVRQEFDLWPLQYYQLIQKQTRSRILFIVHKTFCQLNVQFTHYTLHSQFTFSE